MKTHSKANQKEIYLKVNLKRQKPTKMIPGCFTPKQSNQGLVHAES